MGHPILGPWEGGQMQHRPPRHLGAGWPRLAILGCRIREFVAILGWRIVISGLAWRGAGILGVAFWGARR